MLEREGTLTRASSADAARDLGDLPPPETRRWVARRKAEVVAAVKAERLSVEEACERYKISQEEFASWRRALDLHGVGGLRVTRLQQFR